MQTIHDLLHTARVVPPMNVEDVNIISAELLQARINAIAHRLEIVTRVENLLLDGRIVTPVVDGVLHMHVRTCSLQRMRTLDTLVARMI